MKHSEEYKEDLDRWESIATNVYTFFTLQLKDLEFKVLLDIRELLQKKVKKK
jgi:hypothetical protein